MRKVKDSNHRRPAPPSVFKTGPLPALATFHGDRNRNRTGVKQVLQTCPSANIGYSIRCGGQWNRTITGITRNTLAACRNKPAFAYPPYVGDVGFEPTPFLMYRIYSPAPLHHRDRSPICSHGRIRTGIQQILSLPAFPVSPHSYRTPGGSRTHITPDPKSGDFPVCPQGCKNKNASRIYQEAIEISYSGKSITPPGPSMRDLMTGGNMIYSDAWCKDNGIVINYPSMK